MKKTNKQVLISAVIIFLGMGLIACSPATPKLVPMPKELRDNINNKGDAVAVSPIVDILFIVDNSGSMDKHQKNLADNIELFLSEFTKSNIDYHAGVTTTDMVTDMGSVVRNNCIEYGPLDFLHLICLKYEKTSFVTPQTPDAINVLKKSLLVGTNGSDIEAVFDPLYKAFDSSMKGPGGPNEGFSRDGSYLVVVFITDAEDQSNVHHAQDTFDFLVDLKKSKRKVLSYGIIVPTNDQSNCPRDPGGPRGINPIDIEKFLSLTVNAGNNVMNICSPQFGQQLAAFSKDISRFLNGTIKLNRTPIVSTIKVFFGSQEILPNLKTGWYFDPVDNTVYIGDQVEMDKNQPSDATVTVSYQSVISQKP